MTEIERYIRTAAIARGIDPDVAVRIAMTEGGVTDPVRQSDIVGPNGRELSFGPFQMNISGGLGAQLLKAGVDVRDPANWKKGVDYALDIAAQKRSWGDWHGARDNNIANDAGFSEATKPLGVTLTSLRHVGGAGSSDANFAQPTTLTVDPSIATAEPGHPAAPAEPAAAPTEKSWSEKLKEIAEGDDAKALVEKVTGKGEDGSSSGLYKGDQQLTSILPSLEAGDMARMQAAQTMMAQLMASKKRAPRGLTLTGVPNAV